MCISVLSYLLSTHRLLNSPRHSSRYWQINNRLGGLIWFDLVTVSPLTVQRYGHDEWEVKVRCGPRMLGQLEFSLVERTLSASS